MSARETLAAGINLPVRDHCVDDAGRGVRKDRKKIIEAGYRMSMSAGWRPQFDSEGHVFARRTRTM